MKECKLSVVLILILVNSLILEAGEAELRRVREEYPKASQQIQDRLKQVRGTGHLTVISSARGAEIKQKDLRPIDRFFTYNVDHGFRKYTSVRTVADAPQNPHVVNCYGTDIGYVLELNRKTNEYAITSRGADLRSRSIFNHVFGKFLDVSFSVAGVVPLASWLENPTCELISAETVRRNGRNLIRLKARWGSLDANSVVVDFDPEMGWVIRSAIRNLEEGGDFSFIADYAEDGSGLPMPTLVNYINLDGAHITCRFNRSEFAPTPVSEFEIDYYLKPGIPSKSHDNTSSEVKPVHGRTSTLTYFIILILIIALISLLLSLRLRHLSNKNSRSRKSFHS